MEKLNMASLNTLFKKGYLLAGVVMAANMFIVNEIKASSNPVKTEDNPKEKELLDTKDPEFSIGEQSEQEEKPNKEGEIDTDEKKTGASKTWSVQNILDKVLSHENIINLFGGLAFSCVNNYLKWWDYNPGGYLNLRIGCLGWRSKSFLNGTSQFEITLNLGRGAFWMIATFFGSNDYLKGKIIIGSLTNTAAVIMASVITEGWENGPRGKILFFFLSSLQGFVSMPIAIHISIFSIAISLDSIIWELVSGLLKIVRVNMEKEQIKKNEMNDDNKVKEFDHSLNNNNNL